MNHGWVNPPIDVTHNSVWSMNFCHSCMIPQAAPSLRKCANKRKCNSKKTCHREKSFKKCTMIPMTLMSPKKSNKIQEISEFSFWSSVQRWWNHNRMGIQHWRTFWLELTHTHWEKNHSQLFFALSKWVWSLSLKLSFQTSNPQPKFSIRHLSICFQEKIKNDPIEEFKATWHNEVLWLDQQSRTAMETFPCAWLWENEKQKHSRKLVFPLESIQHISSIWVIPMLVACVTARVSLKIRFRLQDSVSEWIHGQFKKTLVFDPSTLDTWSSLTSMKISQKSKISGATGSLCFVVRLLWVSCWMPKNCLLTMFLTTCSCVNTSLNPKNSLRLLLVGLHEIWALDFHSTQDEHLHILELDWVDEIGWSLSFLWWKLQGVTRKCWQWQATCHVEESKRAWCAKWGACHSHQMGIHCDLDNAQHCCGCMGGGVQFCD